MSDTFSLVLSFYFYGLPTAMAISFRILVRAEDEPTPREAMSNLIVMTGLYPIALPLFGGAWLWEWAMDRWEASHEK